MGRPRRAVFVPEDAQLPPCEWVETTEGATERMGLDEAEKSVVDSGLDPFVGDGPDGEYTVHSVAEAR